MSSRWLTALGFGLLLAFATAPGAVRAQPDEDDGDGEGEYADEGGEDDSESYTGIGPFEFAPLPLGGNVGAPRSAVPETRFGLATHWMRSTWPGMPGSGEAAVDELSLLAEAHLGLFDMIEVGVDFELIQYVDWAGETRNEFGFITPRAKYAFVSNQWLTVAAGLGVRLPTASGWEGVTPLAFEPAFYAQLTILSWLSINASLPLVVDVRIPDVGANESFFFLIPSIGAAVMPIDYIGGFADLQFHVYLDDGELTIMNLMIGLRSNPMSFIMLEAGAIVPLAGDATDMMDFGLGARAAVVLDLF